MLLKTTTSVTPQIATAHHGDIAVSDKFIHTAAASACPAMSAAVTIFRR